ncbi:MAG TPA: hypothetical protein VFM02_04510 [Candidatus Paceibacterota bacterium]|nr:hypothetical protein [Candidatus Paceibacterota bacterium]
MKRNKEEEAMIIIGWICVVILIGGIAVTVRDVKRNPQDVSKKILAVILVVLLILELILVL